jgi:hypothetical protein
MEQFMEELETMEEVNEWEEEEEYEVVNIDEYWESYNDYISSYIY